MRKVILYGGGGHCVPVADALQTMGQTILHIIDDDPQCKGRAVSGFEITGGFVDLPDSEVEECEFVVAVARNDIRQRIVTKLTEHSCVLGGVRHPSAIISRNACVHPSAQVMAGVIVNAGAEVGAHVVLNTGCIVEHDCRIGAFAHIGPAAALAGAVVVEEGAFIALGARVGPFVQVGAWSIVGAGAVALENVPERVLSVGVPARVVRKENQR